MLIMHQLPASLPRHVLPASGGESGTPSMLGSSVRSLIRLAASSQQVSQFQQHGSCDAIAFRFEIQVRQPFGNTPNVGSLWICILGGCVSESVVAIMRRPRIHDAACRPA